MNGHTCLIATVVIVLLGLGSSKCLLAMEEQTSEKQKELRKMQESFDYPAIARAYADYMIKYGRDRYGKVHSPVFVSIMDRKKGVVFSNKNQVPFPHIKCKPFAPGLRSHHKMRPQDRTYTGANPLEDLPLYRLLYLLTKDTGDKQYAAEADLAIKWFLDNTQSPATGLYAWGSHAYWDVYGERVDGMSGWYSRVQLCLEVLGPEPGTTAQVRSRPVEQPDCR